jgi:selenocysteine-specific elongation factor
VLRARLEQSQVQAAFDELINDGLLLSLEGENQQPSREKMIVAKSSWNTIVNQVDQIIQDFHRIQPLKPGLPREELKSRLKIPSPIYNLMIYKLANDGRLIENGALVTRPGFEITYTPSQQISIKKLKERFSQSPFSPPAVKECQTEVGEDLYNALVETSELKQISSDVVFRPQDFELLVTKTRQHIQQQGQITVAEARDLFNTSRRYVLALLEYLDTIGITTRDGDVRRLRR